MSDRHSLSLAGLRAQWESPRRHVGEIALQGDLDNLSVPLLRQALEAFYAEECFTIRLDLAGLAFIDSSGLGAMVGAWRRCQREDGAFQVLHPSVPVKRLLDVTGIAKLLLPAA